MGSDHQYLLICGAPKSATTSIFRYLGDHPEACPANRKETYFFAREYDYDKVCKVGYGKAEFIKYFSHCNSLGELRVEATPYTMYSDGAENRIRETLSSVKILFILRDPIQRLVSDFHMAVANEHVSARDSFDQYVKDQVGVETYPPSALKKGCYSEYLQPYIDTFGRANILILLFEDIIMNPQKEMSKICAFAGISPEFYNHYNFNIHNPTQKIRNKRLTKLVKGLSPKVSDLRAMIISQPLLYKIINALIRSGKSILYASNKRNSVPNFKISAETLSFLEDYYRPFNQQLKIKFGCKHLWNY